MPDLFHPQSPLVQIDLGEAKGTAPGIQEIPFLGYLNLRGQPGNTEFTQSVEKILHCELPLEPNTMVETEDRRIYWLGPDEWLIVTAQPKQLQAQLSGRLGGIFSSVVDNSSGLTMLEIRGENAAHLLATDCPLELHPDHFKPGQCAQTRLAKAGMTIAPLRNGTGFEVIIRRSFAEYILLWMQQAALAFESNSNG